MKDGLRRLDTLPSSQTRSPPLQVACGDGATTRAGEDSSEDYSVFTHPPSAKPPQQWGLRTGSTESFTQDLLTVLLIKGESLLSWR